MPTKLILASAVLLTLPLMAAQAQGLVLAQKGESPFVIVRSVNASPTEIHAAGELQAFLEQISGARLPIVTDDEPVGPHEVMLGDTTHQKPAGIAVNYEKLGDEGFNIRTTGDHLSIAGGRLRGTMYGVYTLLEDYLGCRWFSSKVSRIPKRDRIVLPRINETQVPVLEYREPFYTDAFDPDWAARNKMNSSSARLDEQRGGKITYRGFVHTFYPLLSPDQYFEQHPEYFSLIDGKRTHQRGQLCLTNPDVLRIVTDRVKQWLRDSPGANIVSVSQNDWHGWCTCDACKAIDEREDSHAGTMIQFVNQVAENIEAEFPDVAIDTLAYQYTRKPPEQVRPRHNVIVRLCSIECCFSHPLATDPENRSFRDDIIGWSKLTDRLYIWDYVTSFAHYVNPFPNFQVLQPNIQFFVDHGVKGIFEEGNYNSEGGEFAELRAYVMAKLLWDPDYDVEMAMDEFLEASYGEAAGPIRAYIDLLRDKVVGDDIHMRIWVGPDSAYLSDDVLRHADGLWAHALRFRQDPETDFRVQVASLPIKYVHIMRMKPGPARIELLDQFMAIAKKKGITRISEGRMLEDWENAVRGQG